MVALGDVSNVTHAKFGSAQKRGTLRGLTVRDVASPTQSTRGELDENEVVSEISFGETGQSPLTPPSTQRELRLVSNLPREMVESALTVTGLLYGSAEAIEACRNLRKSNRGGSLLAAGVVEALVEFVAARATGRMVDMAVEELHEFVRESRLSRHARSLPRCSRMAGVLMDYCETSKKRHLQARVLETLHMAICDGAVDVHALLADGRVIGYAIDALRSSLECDDSIQFEIGEAAFKLVAYACQGGSRGLLRRAIGTATKDAAIEADGVEALWTRVVALRRKARQHKLTAQWRSWADAALAVEAASDLLSNFLAVLGNRRECNERFSSEGSASLSKASLEANMRMLAETDDCITHNDEEYLNGAVATTLEEAHVTQEIPRALEKASSTVAQQITTRLRKYSHNARRRYLSHLADCGALDALGRMLCRVDCRVPAASALTAVIDASDVYDERARRAVVALKAIQVCLTMVDEGSDNATAAAGLALLRALTDPDELDRLSDELQRASIVPRIAQKLAPATLAYCLNKRPPHAARLACTLVSNCAKACREDATAMVSHVSVIAALVKLLPDEPLALDALADIAFECRASDSAFCDSAAVPAIANIARTEIHLPKDLLRPVSPFSPLFARSNAVYAPTQALTTLAALVLLHKFDVPFRKDFIEAQVTNILQDFLDQCDDVPNGNLVYRRARSETLVFYQTALEVLEEVLHDTASIKVWCNSHNSWITPKNGLGWNLPLLGT